MKPWFHSIFLCTTLCGCLENGMVGSDHGPVTDIDRRVVEVVRMEYWKAGEYSLLHDISMKYTVLVDTCAHGYLVEFSPKKYDGLDGGFYYFVDEDMKGASSVFEWPNDCAHEYRPVELTLERYLSIG